MTFIFLKKTIKELLLDDTTLQLFHKKYRTGLSDV